MCIRDSFDAAVGAKDRAAYDIDFLLSGAAAYFLSDNFGSAKVLCSEYFERNNPDTTALQKIMGNFLGYLLLNRELHINNDTPTGEKLCRSLLAYYTSGKKPEEIQNILLEYRKEIYAHDTPMETVSYTHLGTGPCWLYRLQTWAQSSFPALSASTS